MEHDPYIILGVDKKATQAQIRNAYKKLVRTLHPDKAKTKVSDDVTERLITIKDAYNKLADPESRQAIDDELKDDPILHWINQCSKQKTYAKETHDSTYNDNNVNASCWHNVDIIDRYEGSYAHSIEGEDVLFTMDELI